MMHYMRASRTDLDDTDLKLLAALQKDAHLTAEALGARLHLSASQAGRRRQRLEAEGSSAGISPGSIRDASGSTCRPSCRCQLGTHGPEQAQSFSRLLVHPVRDHLGLDADRRGGLSAAGLLRGSPALNRLMHEVLLPHPAVARVQSQIVMDQTKPDAPFPV